MSQVISESTINEVLHELASEEGKTREAGAKRAAREHVEDERIVSELHTLAFLDPVKYVRNAASDALSELKAPTEVLDALGSERGIKREAGAKRAAREQIKDERVVSKLQTMAISDPVNIVRDAAASALRSLQLRVPSSAEWLELHQVKFLVEKTEGWTESAERRRPYQTRLEALSGKFFQSAVITPPAPSVPAIAQTAAQAVAPAAKAPPTRAPIPKPAAPPAPTVPFDQWLLSERNIKLALYSGGALLILAGLIFIGVNWEYLPGLAKLGVTLVLTAALYVGGALLFRRSALRIGGVALLAIASAFVPLNFAVLQIYVLGERGVNPEFTWLCASAICALLYAFTAWRTHHELFTFFSIGALASGVAAAGILFELRGSGTILAYALFVLLLAFGAHAVRGKEWEKYTRRAFFVSAQIGAALVLLGAALNLDFGSLIFYYGYYDLLSVFLTVSAMTVVALAYVIMDMLEGKRWARWAWAFTFAATFVAALHWLDWPSLETGVTLKLSAFAYLIGGYVLMRHTKEGKLHAGLPLFAAGYTLAAFGSLLALLKVATAPGELALMLLGDVALLGVSAYIFRDVRWLYAATWLSVAPAYLCATLYLHEPQAQGIALSGLMLVYAGLGYIVSRRALKLALPFVSAAGILALLSFVLTATHTPPLALSLFADVILLAILFPVTRRYEWVYGATWLFIAPVYLCATLYLPTPQAQGLVLGALMLAYVAAGYWLGRRTLIFGGPFLSAAALLSLIVPLLTGTNWALTSAVLVVIAALYSFIALWQRREWLLLPALAAVNLALLTLTLIGFTPGLQWVRVLVLGFAALGMVLTLAGLWLRTTGRKVWGLPLYVVAFADLLGAYLAALALDAFTNGLPFDQLLVVGLSALLAALAWSLTWFERAAVAQLKLPPVFSYLAPVLLLVSLFSLIRFALPTSPYQPAIFGGCCAAMVGVAWFLRGTPWHELYGEPLRHVGLLSLLVPLTIVSVSLDILPIAVTFAIAGGVLIAEGGAGHNRYLVYLGGGAFVVVIWSLLRWYNVTEPQAYVIPPGVGLLALGWNERRHGKPIEYQLATLLGLFLLMGSAFYQSFDNAAYALLLLVESVAALGWGVWMRARRYVEVAVLALIINALAQFGPGFVQLDRWAQIGIIGTLLLGAGLAALFRRERILVARHDLAEQWKGLGA